MPDPQPQQPLFTSGALHSPPDPSSSKPDERPTSPHTLSQTSNSQQIRKLGSRLIILSIAHTLVLWLVLGVVAIWLMLAALGGIDLGSTDFDFGFLAYTFLAVYAFLAFLSAVIVIILAIRIRKLNYSPDELERLLSYVVRVSLPNPFLHAACKSHCETCRTRNLPVYRQEYFVTHGKI